MKCLVLGGTGFIGKHLCEKLLKENHSIRVLGKNSIDNIDFAFNWNAEFIEKDYLLIDDFTELLNGIDVVFHLISTTIPSDSSKVCVFDITSNVIPTLRLLDACVKLSIKKIIFLSSGGTVYGIPKNTPMPEEHPTNPICSYGIHKLTIEKYLQFYYMQYGLDYRVIRLSNPYGTGQNLGKNQGVVPIFLDKILHNKPIEVWGDGSIIRDYIYIDDAIEGIISALYYEGVHKIFNIGSGFGMSILEVIHSISNILNIKCEINYLEARKIDVPVNILDISRAKENLFWKCNVNFENGIKMMMKNI
jgi:UDP-glucose 4-epimerase